MLDQLERPTQTVGERNAEFSFRDNISEILRSIRTAVAEQDGAKTVTLIAEAEKLMVQAKECGQLFPVETFRSMRVLAQDLVAQEEKKNRSIRFKINTFIGKLK